jgi:hypothetical protein
VLLHRCHIISSASAQNGRQYDNEQNDGQNQQQATRLTPCLLLIPTRRSQFKIRASRILHRVLHIILNDIERLALLSHNVRHIAEQLIQLANALLDIADLRLALDNQRLLEVDLVLWSESQLLLLLLLLLLTWLISIRLIAGGAAATADGGPLGIGGRPLLLECKALDRLEFVAGGLEFAREFLLGVFL